MPDPRRHAGSKSAVTQYRGLPTDPGDAEPVRDSSGLRASLIGPGVDPRSALAAERARRCH